MRGLVERLLAWKRLIMADAAEVKYKGSDVREFVIDDEA